MIPPNDLKKLIAWIRVSPQNKLKLSDLIRKNVEQKFQKKSRQTKKNELLQKLNENEFFKILQEIEGED